MVLTQAELNSLKDKRGRDSQVRDAPDLQEVASKFLVRNAHESKAAKRPGLTYLNPPIMILPLNIVSPPSSKEQLLPERQQLHLPRPMHWEEQLLQRKLQ